MDLYYFESPHKQITENFIARVIKVTDGDTIRVKVDFRNFDFPIRMAEIAAPESDESGGRESRRWLASKILNKDVEIIINKKNRVGRWGRLLGEVMFSGMNMGEESINMGHSVPFGQQESGIITKLETIKI